MKHFTIQDTAVPALGLGTYLLKGNTCIEITKAALEMGYRHIDTAQLYENEAEVGTAIKQSPISRSDIFLTTKVWPTNLSKDKFMPSVDISLKKLQTDYVDLLLIHWPSDELPLDAYLPELVKAQEQGKAKFIGVSNFNTSQIEETLRLGTPIVNNQVEYHPFLNLDKLHNIMQRNNLTLTAYCPIAKGKVNDNAAIVNIGNKYGKSGVQVTLRWMMQLEHVLAIPKTSKVERLKQNMNIFDFELSAEDMQIMNSLKSANARIVGNFFGAVWD